MHIPAQKGRAANHSYTMHYNSSGNNTYGSAIKKFKACCYALDTAFQSSKIILEQMLHSTE